MAWLAALVDTFPMPNLHDRHDQMLIRYLIDDSVYALPNPVAFLAR